ncbi:Hypothetical predicted protein, partial [Xyrichtys novacula]
SGVCLSLTGTIPRLMPTLRLRAKLMDDVSVIRSTSGKAVSDGHTGKVPAVQTKRERQPLLRREEQKLR